MSRYVPRNNSPCIAVATIPRQIWLRAALGKSEFGHESEGTVKRTSFRSDFAMGITLAGLLLPAVTPSWAQTASTEQCSLAVVSRLVGSDKRVCDSKIVHEMARRGHAFEQNQMGIASILAIGPDYSEKEALTWFSQAAQRGYAPAEVNLAVMYVNGWGTPVNYGVAL